MIDYVKVRLWNANPKQFLEHPQLDFKSIVSVTTGEIYEGMEAKFQGLTFKIFRNTIKMEGSLHKYWNLGLQNYNDFSAKSILFVLNELAEKFHFDLTRARLENLEVGVNLKLPFNSSKLISNLIYHKMKGFQNISVDKGHYVVACHERYRVKAYDKGTQFRLAEQVFRFELHHSKMIDVNKLGIWYLSDLLDNDKLTLLGNNLKKEWNETYFFDWTLKYEKFSNREKQLYYAWQNADYWLTLDKNNRNKRRASYDKLVAKYSNRIKEQIERLIENKLNDLIVPSGDDLTEKLNLKSGDLLTI